MWLPTKSSILNWRTRERGQEGRGTREGEEGRRRTSLFNLFDFLYLSFGDEHPVHGIH